MPFAYTNDDFARENLRNRLPSGTSPAPVAPDPAAGRPSPESIESLRTRLHDSIDVRHRTSAPAGALASLPEPPDAGRVAAEAALDAFLWRSVAGKVPKGVDPGRVVEALRGRFAANLTAAGSVGIASRTGRTEVEELADVLAELGVGAAV